MSYGLEEIDMQNYLKAGEQRALRLSNRGPLSFNNDGTLHKEILDSYSKNERDLLIYSLVKILSQFPIGKQRANTYYLKDQQKNCSN